MKPLFIRSLIKLFSSCSILIILAMLINSCSNSCSSCNSCASSSSATNLGTLPNGSTVYVSSNNFNVSSNSGSTTGSIGLTGGTAGYTGTLTATLSNLSRNRLGNLSTTPGITLTPSPCVLIAGNPQHLACTLTITIESSVLNGKYFVVPTFTPESSGSPTTLNTFSITVSNNPESAGNLSIQIESQSLVSGESSIAIVSLSNSINIGSVVVSLTSSNSNIIALNGANTCTLSTESNTCYIPYIAGSESGSATINASAPGYNTVSSSTIEVNTGIRPGTLAISIPQTVLIYGESTSGSVTLEGSMQVESLTVNLSSDHESAATVIPSSCTLSSAHNSCNIVVTAQSESDESTTITASADGYQSSSTDIIVKTPAELYFTTNNGLTYRSTDGLLSSSAGISVDTTSINSMILANGILYLGTSAGSVYRESNGIWYQIGGEQVAPNGSVTSIAIDGAIVYAAVNTSDTAAVYTESGSGWNLVGESVILTNGGVINSIAVKGGNIYAGGVDKDINKAVVYKYDSKSWSLLDGSVFSGKINSIAINGNTIFVGGDNSIEVSGNPVFAAGDASANIKSNADTTSGVVYFNNQAGGGWQEACSHSVVANGTVNSIYIGSSAIYAGGYNNGSNLAAAESCAFGGNSWGQISTALPTSSSVKFVTSPDGGQNIYAAVNSTGNNNGTVYVESNGNAWTILNSVSVESNATVNSISIKAGSAIYAATSSSNLYKDSANKWTTPISGAVCESPITTIVNLQNSIYVNCGNSVYKDQGDWQLFGNEAVIANGVVNSISLNPIDLVVYAAGQNYSNNSAIVYSNNGKGSGWQLVGGESVMVNGVINSVAYTTAGIYAGGRNYDNENAIVFKSSDGGAWTQVGPKIIANGSVSSIAATADYLYAGANDQLSGNANVYKESNGAWTQIGGGNLVETGSVNTIFVNGGSVYAATSDKVTHEGAVYLSSAGGNWSLVANQGIPIEYGSSALAVTVDINNDVYVTTDMNSILFSRHGTSPWVKLPYGSYSSQLAIPAMALFDQ